MDDIEEFERAFSSYTGAKRTFLIGSGTAALYTILSALKRFSSRSEVILPAYTVPTLTLAITRAGLKTRLCDIDPGTFNMSPSSLADVVSKDTLAVVPVHMFGFPMDIEKINEIARSNGSFVIEDGAQALGATLQERRVGRFSNTGFFSMCKGKIVSTFRGGMITVNDPDIAGAIEEEIGLIPSPGRLFDLRLIVTLVLLSKALNPYIYGTLYPLIATFKSTEVHTRFEPVRATPFTARLGLIQMEHIDEEVKKRIKNGMALHKALKNIRGIRLPDIIEGAVPTFNHLPIVVEDTEKIVPLTKALFKRGIDTARMYLMPIHKIYDLGYSETRDPFPNATYLARRLTVLPTHPGVTERDRGVIIDTIREFFEDRP